MKNKKDILYLLFMLMILGKPRQAVAQTFTTVYEFTETSTNTVGVYTNSDGANPYAGLIICGNTLYGTTPEGGTRGYGTVFAVNVDGTGFTNLYNFIDSDDGANPHAGLILSSNTLYGTTTYGGASNNGAVFAINIDGTGFTNLYSFSGGNDGADPRAGLILSSNTLYGATTSGGASNNGAVFAINTDGTGFTNLYSFTGGNDGADPGAGLILSSNTLYGTATFGGSSNNGVVFAIHTDGTGFTNLYSFAGVNDGAGPFASLTLSSNTLYGTTTFGGASNIGAVFSIHTDGTGFTNLYSFTGGNDGANPFGGLILSSNTLYGTTISGGASNNGVVFAINTDGTDFVNLYSFTGGNDGANPFAGLILSSNTLYGTTTSGRSSGSGTVFSLSTNTDLIYGYILDSYDQPVIGVDVYAVDSSGDVLTNTTDVSGYYSFAVKVGGKWQISVDCSQLNGNGDGCVAEQIPAIYSGQNVEVDFSPCDSVGIVQTYLPPGQIGSPYYTSLQVAGCNPPFHWSSSGSMPSGLQLSPDGEIYGIPTNNGNFSFSSSVTDAYGNTASLAFSLPVFPSLTLPQLQLVPNQAQSSPGLFQFSLAGDLANYYTIEYSTNLVDWLPIMVTNPSVLVNFPETNAVGFYRTYQSGITVSQSALSFGASSAGTPVFYVNASNGVAVVTIFRSGALSSNLVVNYFTSDGTASNGCDYTPVSGTLDFAPGVVSNSISVPVSLDCASDQSATVNLYLSDVSLNKVLHALLIIQRPPPKPVLSYITNSMVLLFDPIPKDGGSIMVGVSLENAGPPGSVLPYSASALGDFSQLVTPVTFEAYVESARTNGYLASGQKVYIEYQINTNYLLSLTAQQQFDQLLNPIIPINVASNCQFTIPTINVARTLEGAWRGTWYDYNNTSITGSWELQFNSISWDLFYSASATASFTMFSGNDFYDCTNGVLPFALSFGSPVNVTITTGIAPLVEARFNGNSPISAGQFTIPMMMSGDLDIDIQSTTVFPLPPPYLSDLNQIFLTTTNIFPDPVAGNEAIVSGSK